MERTFLSTHSSRNMTTFASMIHFIPRATQRRKMNECSSLKYTKFIASEENLFLKNSSLNGDKRIDQIGYAHPVRLIGEWAHKKC